MEQKILPPKKVVSVEEGLGKGTITIEGCYPGYASTLGNALRRVLLSSLSGAAIVSVKMKGVKHEFSTIPGVLEDVVQIILNLKKIRLRLNGEEPVRISLKAKGEKVVTAADFKASSDVEIVSKEAVIATLTDKKSELDMEVTINQGIGYVPVEQQTRDEKEVGVIAIDAIYTPIRRVNFTVQNMRIGKRTDYEKVVLDIETDGSISPKEAFDYAVGILIDQFSFLAEGQAEEKE